VQNGEFVVSSEQKRRPFDRAYRERIGAKLRKARKGAGYRLEEVANAVGVTRQSVVQWETGKAFPAPEHLSGLIDLYGLSVESLLKGDQQIAEDRTAYEVSSSRAAIAGEIQETLQSAEEDLPVVELRRIRDHLRFMVQQARQERQKEVGESPEG